jgi:hypothetical protein
LSRLCCWYYGAAFFKCEKNEKATPGHTKALRTANATMDAPTHDDAPTRDDALADQGSRAPPPPGADESPETRAVREALESFSLKSSFGLTEAKTAAKAQAKAANAAGAVFYAGFLASVADLEKEVPPAEFSYGGGVPVTKTDKETKVKTTEIYRYQSFADYRERRVIKAEDRLKRPISLAREFKNGLALYLSCAASVYEKVGRQEILTLDRAQERASDPADPLPPLGPLLFMREVVASHRTLLAGRENLRINCDFSDTLKDAMKALYPPADTTFYTEAAALARDYYKCLAYYAASRAVTKKIASARLPLLCDLTRCLEAPCSPPCRGLGNRLFACVERDAPAARGGKNKAADPDGGGEEAADPDGGGGEAASELGDGSASSEAAAGAPGRSSLFGELLGQAA